VFVDVEGTRAWPDGGQLYDETPGHDQDVGKPFLGTSWVIGVGGVLDVRIAVHRPDDGNHIETTRRIAHRVFHEVIACGAFDTTPFGGRHGVERVLAVIARARLDLNEDKFPCVGGDEIDLTGGTTVVPREHTMACAAQRAGGESFTLRSEVEVPVRPRRPRADQTS